MTPAANQNPEQLARDQIDKHLADAGWHVQNMKDLDWSVGQGIAVREYQTDTGPADYVLFVDRRAVGVIEAKPKDWGHKITTVEDQSSGYASAKLKWVNNKEPLPYVYESTGVITRFTDGRDPKPRSREVFTFHRPETMAEWLSKPKSLRARLHDIPPLDPAGLRDCQITAIRNLEKSFREDRPRALVQMATGSGKTFTAITSVYRLLKFADAKRILFLVDTKNLGEQAEQEFMSYLPNDDNRKFTELYNVQRLRSPFIAGSSQVCISTIQRMYSILKDEPLDESVEEGNPAERLVRGKAPLPVVYNPKIPPEFFDFIVIDECHRSIYNLWRQVLEYFDATLIGLTATPDNRTYGFFHKNVVSEYGHERAVADGVNVGNEVYVIDTQITRQGAQIKAQQQVEKRERLTRQKRWERQDEDEQYSATRLDRDVVNPDQIRTVVRAFCDSLPVIFPGREEVPKTLIFAKTDSHADDIINIVRQEFGQGNDFCKKITYQATEDPKSVLAQFRNNYNPRIAVTVDMIATGTDVKPLECLLFMRDVKSRNYFEQMKGRGTRTLDADSLKKVTPSAKTAKTHYVIVDAIGVTKSCKTASEPIITKPHVPLKDLATGVMMGVRDEDTVSSLAGRLARLDKQLDDKEQARIAETAGGVPLHEIVRRLFDAIDPDRIEEEAVKAAGGEPTDAQREQARDKLVGQAANVFTGPLINLIDGIRREKEQTIDHDNLDTVIGQGWDGDAKENAEAMAKEFADYLAEHRDAIEALTIFYSQPARRSHVTYAMVKAVLDALKTDRPKLAPLRVWRAYALLDEYKGSDPVNELTALVALIRRVCGIDAKLAPYADKVRRNFQNWILKRHSGAGEKFTEEQMDWLRMVRDHIATSFHVEHDDLDMSPFDAKGGLGKMYQLFGAGMNSVIDELNEALAV
ncbi:DEAD/DEAH box helicase family protein [Gluconacetobacter azotocaptans]|uniref:DEAD/DEAH box helicase family protein n=1 Tax=Gluconacetobacter azotocaptans TaxID=142834 RepID=A0A7W4PE74_9PROT|nr:DEAD/DEAH box helicase family protein [Gluconacetobacter azotocaptans]MBB2190528.1 DEAD/DEAH box helicase family protein [Gluconacetobacter azotocaptans]GBQ28437.1 type I site-specific deoxyribonuclease [Gluconacetobacter azotocaptans DSM 13594]